MRGFRAALQVLTRLPSGQLRAVDFAAAPGWFAAVGALLGAAQALAFALALPLWGPWLAAFAALAVGVLLTGGLHEDGLADTADALGGGRDRAHALEILKDSRIGAFGALALIFMLGAQVSALAALGAAAPVALVVAAVWSRAAMAGVLRLGPYLRASGAASGMTGGWPVTARAAVLAALGLALALGLRVLGLSALAGLIGLALLAGGTGFFARARLGGITGDVLGAVQQAGMLGFLLGALAWR